MKTVPRLYLKKDIMRAVVEKAHAVLLFAMILLSACAQPLSPDRGNSPGYTTHFLSAESRLSKDVTINGLDIDVTSTDTIITSVQSIIESESVQTIVEETDGRLPDMLIDFSAAALPVPDNYYGMDIQWWSKYFLTLPAYRELARHVKFDIARFPGGQERNRYDRTAVTTDGDALGMDQPYQFVLTGEDIENFISFCRELDIEAEPEFNLFSEDPAMWADMVDQIVNELGYDLKYLSAGNEPEVNNFGNWDVLEVTDKNAAFLKYMSNFLNTREAVEEVKPGLVYALAETGEWDEPELGENLDVFLGNLNGVDPGAISVHWYMLGEWEGEAEDFPLYPSLDHLVISGNYHHDINYLSTVASTMRQKAEAFGLQNTRIFMGEWDLAWTSQGANGAASALHESLASVIFGAEVLEYCKGLGFSSLQYFSFSDPEEWSTWRPALIGISEDHTAINLRPVYYLYLMYEYFYGDRIVNVSGGRDADWSVYASKTETENFLLLINRTEDTEIMKIARIITDDGVRYLKLTLYPRSVAMIGFD